MATLLTTTEENCTFKDFLAEFSVGRLGKLTDLETFLQSNDWRKLSRDDLDKMDNEAKKLGINMVGKTENSHDTDNGKSARSIRSLISKVSAFARPEEFVMMDRFSVAGMAKYIAACGNRKGFKAKGESRVQGHKGYENSISVYSSNFELIATQQNGSVEAAHNALPENMNISPRAFRNRLIDNYLMALGGRYDVIFDGLTGALKDGSEWQERYEHVEEGTVRQLLKFGLRDGD